MSSNSDDKPNKASSTLKKEILYKDKNTGVIVPQNIGKKAEKKEEERLAREGKEKKERIEEMVEKWLQEYFEAPNDNKEKSYQTKKENKLKSEVIDCWFDTKCTNVYCKYKHSYELCRYSNRCYNQFCRFRHPENRKNESIKNRKIKDYSYPNEQNQRRKKSIMFQNQRESKSSNWENWGKILWNLAQEKPRPPRDKQNKPIEVFIEVLGKLLNKED